MTEAYTMSAVLLGIAALALALTTMVLARQVSRLYERVAPAGALTVNGKIRSGDAAPPLQLPTIAGQSHEIAPARGRQLLFFLAPDCPVCKSLLPVLKTLPRAEHNLDVVLLSDGDDQHHQEFVREHGLESFAYCVSEAAGRAYGIGKIPYGVLISNGKVAALGILNSREHLESLFEAERMGLSSLQEYLAAE